VVNCQEFRKFLYAFGDGELVTNDNLGALEHLNMCPTCCAKVDAQAQLKARLKQHFGADHAPDRLGERILSAIHAEQGATSTGWRPRVFARVGAPMALAASVALAFVGTWWFNSQGSGPFDPGTTAHVQPALGTVTVAQIEGQYTACGMMGDGHHVKALSRKYALMQAEMEQKVGHKVLAPDLTSVGYVLQSGCFCGLPKNPGANVVYRDKAGKHLLVIFSIKRIQRLVGPDVQDHQEDGKDCRIGEGCTNSIISFDEQGATFILCAPLKKEDLLKLVEPLRMALRRQSMDSDWTLAKW